MTLRANQQPTSDTAIVFISHCTSVSVQDRFVDLIADAPRSHDVYFLFDATNTTSEDKQIIRGLAGDRLRTFVESDITTNPYPNPWAEPNRRQLLPGNTDLLFLHFSHMEPDYSRYWFIEYDVVYSGSWTAFFKTFDDSAVDLLGTTLHPYDRRPEWHWWSSLDTPFGLNQSEWVRGFFPILRVSDKLLAYLHQAYLDGWCGHVEVVLPTLANHYGLSMEDIGGGGPYVRTGHTNRFYTNSPEFGNLFPGTFVYRPVRAHPGGEADMLWHPVKPNQGALRPYANLLKFWFKSQLSNL